MMIATISAFSFVLGAILAYVAISYPEYPPVIQTSAGILLFVALALLGYLLEALLGHRLTVRVLAYRSASRSLCIAHHRKNESPDRVGGLGWYS
jgi:protein-S-isoprenylcysteine O-methyltransferase Ste14